MLHFFWSGYNLIEGCYERYEYSNLEIAKWAEYYLSQKTNFHQANWLDGKVTNHPEDILIGHPTWDNRGQSFNISEIPKLLRNWVTDNALNTHKKCHPNTYILMPWVPNFPPEWTKCMPFYQQQLRAANKIFALCGEIWIERTFAKQDASIQYEVKDKLIHCNMGVASQNFPIKKEKFNVIGERQLLHISNLGSYKGFDLTCMSLIGSDTLLHVASPSIQSDLGLIEANVNGKDCVFNFIGKIDNNDPEFNHWVVENCDFYIHTATMDAQATTTLENAARGLIPLVTPESGFACPEAIYLTADPDENRKIIEWALNLPDAELMKRSQLIREYVEREHNWQNIYDKIWQEILIDMEKRIQH
ncbi:glycosyltransferase [Anabaena sp. UHCC 0253]|uniref:glycosyltransferase n=1 Tax=Anabaena sp. UHCC 0253 TaxID=2590019 RepID=UPI00144587E7|nr:glycosyltransferase [Anabaena sp. UHCC 0253]MTJ52447.1 glycosyltransferase [Anabaena sp. UHCC 0253]